MKDKPPLGIKPKHVHDQIRLEDIIDAIVRYVQAKRPIPMEWVEEYNDIIEKYDLGEDELYLSMGKVEEYNDLI